MIHIEEYIEHAALKPDTITGDIETLCSEAIAYGFSTVCVPPLFVKKARLLTAGTGIRISTVIGFPFGYSAVEAKVAEIVLAIIDGIDEVEMVIHTAAVKNNDWQYLAGELNSILPIIRGKGKKITVILETGLMTEHEIIKACDIYGTAGVDFVRVGTGFIANALILDYVRLARKYLNAAVKIKAAAGIKNYKFAIDLIKAGASRLSCSDSVKLIREAYQQIQQLSD